jgi:uncharacterized protein YecT (DUF1311 family)
MRFAVVCAAILAMAGGAAFAQTQLEMNEKAGAELRQAEARMDVVYRDVLAKISDAGKEALQASQETWLNFRNQECAFETMGTAGGSIHPLVVAECRRRLTGQRIKDLEAQLNCQEGNLSCGNQ